MAFTYKRGPIHITLDLGKANSWLPAMAAFLCLGLLAMAALIVLDVNAEPKSRQSAVVTSVSAQGFSGLRRILEARGHEISVNRSDHNPLLKPIDLEIITLDADNGSLTYINLDDSSQSAEQASEGTANSADSQVKDASANIVAVPDAKKSGHLLYQPMGRVVLLVAPKWQAFTDRKNPRWARSETFIKPEILRDSLGILSPVTEKTLTDEKAPENVSISEASSESHIITVKSHRAVITYQKIPYVIHRDANLLAGKSEDGTKIDVPILRPVTLLPAPDQKLFTKTLVLNKVKGLQSISGPNLTPILTGPSGEVILSRVQVLGGKPTKTPVYLLSDPDLLNNLILADPQKVVSAFMLTDSLMPPSKTPGAVVFNLTFNGLSLDHDLLHAISQPPFIGVPLCLLLTGLGLVWAAFARFGPARQAPEGAFMGRGVRILANNAARLMAITIKEPRLGSAYADMVRDQVIRAKGYRMGQFSESPDVLADRIGRIHNTTESFIDLKARAAKTLSVHHLIDMTLRLHAWKTEIQRANI